MQKGKETRSGKPPGEKGGKAAKAKGKPETNWDRLRGEDRDGTWTGAGAGAGAWGGSLKQYV